jgi:phage-related protein
MGLADSNGEISEQAEVMARWALITEQTKNAQGDFARTSDGLANSQRILRAEFKDAIADLGQQFLPIALTLVGVLREAIAWFTGLPGPVQQGILIFALLAAAIGPVLLLISGVSSAIAGISTIITFVGGATFAAIAPIILIVLAVIAVIAVLYLAWTNNWGGIQEKVAAVVAWISTAVQNFITGITSWWNSGTNTLRLVWEGVWNVISTIVTTFVEYIKLLIQAFSYAVSGDWYKFGETLREAWDLIWNAILSILETIWDTIESVISASIQNVISFFKDTDWSQVGQDIINGIINGLENAAGWLADAAQAAAQAALDTAKGFLGIHSPSKKFEMQVGWPTIWSNIPGVA